MYHLSEAVYAMRENCFVTITGLNHYYGTKPFKIGQIIRLVKEPDNEYDSEAIRAELPFIDKIGYVANSPETVARGTSSAGRVYERFDSEALGQVLFVTHDSVICLFLSPADLADNGLAQAAKNQLKIGDVPKVGIIFRRIE
ncbi:hypothetical protein EWH99_05120 [Sporolactobacillus sp. THM7-7]|nr:hypothetical protein EWH99_05120 [Sporolactobacillus sp. THM7-7]